MHRTFVSLAATKVLCGLMQGTKKFDRTFVLLATKNIYAGDAGVSKRTFVVIAAKAEATARISP